MKEYIVQAIAQETIDSFDAHNAPELVRCKDCKHYHNGFNCDLLQKPIMTGDDYYCADGERRDGNA